MKLRIRGNSIRLRLLKSEVETFARDGRVSEQTSFGSNALRYTLAMSRDVETIVAKLDENEIVVQILEQTARDWTTNEEVGFDVEQSVGADETLSIVVEKDFVCIDRLDDPDRDDAFPNPKLVC